MTNFNQQALALIRAGYDAHVIHDDCGEAAERVDPGCACPRFHFWCPSCRFPFDLEG